MQESHRSEGESPQSFAAFLGASRTKILLILLVALAVRAGFVFAFPDPLDETRYRPIAVNILDGNGFSSDAKQPYSPSEAATPAYPLLIATVYAVAGRSVFVLTLTQIGRAHV